ncbi:hypothetical protein NADFUDRAFT_40214 [Nadsonia fulvescens var. elongata DSM 6958]|uniref:Small ribosomal subunit protein mS38 n=1 Tax=Nadsonia fulvescens var. elongata DSM 6958 TaxID=857566 RepID=A0A1E3PNN9_9ASCO|nr:hypothetical protein NADFUDRAFT_40214 [Nadsonia fulvescens var. elongata DSM 6958]
MIFRLAKSLCKGDAFLTRSVHTHSKRKYIDCSKLTSPDISHLHPQEIFYSGFVYGNNPIVPDYIEKCLAIDRRGLDYDLPLRHSQLIAHSRPELPQYILDATLTAYQPPAKPIGKNPAAIRGLTFGRHPSEVYHQNNNVLGSLDIAQAFNGKEGEESFVDVDQSEGQAQAVLLSPTAESTGLTGASGKEFDTVVKELSEKIQTFTDILASSKTKESNLEADKDIGSNRGVYISREVSPGSEEQLFEICESPVSNSFNRMIQLTSVKRKRKLKMNKHKHRKRRKAQKALRRKLGH